MKQSLYILACTMMLNAGLAGTATAQDYSSMSTEDMVQLRSQVRYMSTNDRAAYRTELQSREQNMSKEEKNLYRNMNAPGGGDGSGAGKRQGKGKGSRDGSGNKYRGSRDSSESGYGSGYESRQGSGSGGGRGRGRGH